MPIRQLRHSFSTCLWTTSLLAGLLSHPAQVHSQALNAKDSEATTGLEDRPLLGTTVPGRYLVVFRSASAAQDGAIRLRRAGAAHVMAHPHLGTAAISADTAAVQAIRQDPAVAAVVADRVVYAHRLIRRAQNVAAGDALDTPPASLPRKVILDPVAPSGPSSAGDTTGNGAVSSGDTSGSAGGANGGAASATSQPTDTLYQGSPQGWAVRAAGGYGAGILGGTQQGPWNRSLGTGVRIAVLDSGVDASHPDLAPNLALNLSEVDTAAQPSPCDDGSPQDQQGHGTWVASLAAGAMGANTGRVVGVAPSAALLNIKILQRMPGSGATLAARCAAGEASGLVSWLLKGIDDAVAQHADVIVLSLGSLVDLYTGDGAGLKSAFDSVTHAAANAGVLIVAAAGNDAFDLSNGRYLELPAQARDVLAVVATTNADCAENNHTGATCQAGTVTIPYYSNYGGPLKAVATAGGNYPVGADEAVSGWVRGACSVGKAGTADGPPSDSAHSYGCFNLGHTQYVQAMGTSASAGLAAGAAALLRATHPGWTPADVAAAMRSGSTRMTGDAALLDLQTAMVLP